MGLAEELKPSNSTPEQIVEPDERPKTIGELLALIKATKEANQIIKATKPTAPSKPPGYANKSNCPYYKYQYACVMLQVLDKMMASRKDQMYFYKDFPKLRHETLYQKIMQSLQYLMDRMDSDGKYRAFRECLSITRQRNIGVRLSIRHDLLDEAAVYHNFMPTELCENAMEWRTRMEEYIESGESGVPFEATGLALTEEQMRDLEIQLATLPNISYSISSKTIKLLKL